MSMLSLQTDQLRELAARSEDRELINALQGAAETIEDLVLKHEAADKVTGHYPDGTLCVEVNGLDNVKRVIVKANKERFCKLFYEKANARFFNALKPKAEVDRSWGISREVPACPNCEAIISPMCFWGNCREKVGWCEYCGQKIDWSGWEDE